ncbi:hypothetical protein [Algoriphagus jejuensis]
MNIPSSDKPVAFYNLEGIMLLAIESNLYRVGNFEFGQLHASETSWY